MQIVAHPASVEAFRLGPLPEGISWQDATLSNYPVTSGPVDVPEEIADRVSKALTSPCTYVWSSVKGCVPSYGVRLSFSRGPDRIDVLFCFECDVLLVGRNGHITGGEDFDYARPVFVRAVRVIFPNDAVIQRLRENRRG